MKYHLKFLLLLSCGSQTAGAGEIAGLNEQLKSSYKLDGPGYGAFYQTSKFADSFSMTCNMGQAIPVSNKSNLYTNKPIQGLKLELRAKIAFVSANKEAQPMGFVVVTKNNDDLITFKPIGDYENGVWDGDVFNSWSGTGTDIEVYSGRFGKSGYAHFDLMDGNGFFYKSDSRKHPDYSLSDCKRIKKEKLPIYDWK